MGQPPPWPGTSCPLALGRTGRCRLGRTRLCRAWERGPAGRTARGDRAGRAPAGRPGQTALRQYFSSSGVRVNITGVGGFFLGLAGRLGCRADGCTGHRGSSSDFGVDHVRSVVSRACGRSHVAFLVSVLRRVHLNASSNEELKIVVEGGEVVSSRLGVQRCPLHWSLPGCRACRKKIMGLNPCRVC